MGNEYPSIWRLFDQVRRPTSKYDTYYDAYDELFFRYRDKDIVFLEVGVQGGGSLEVWREYFGSRSRIIGVDLNPELKDELEKDGFEIYIGDQESDAFWKDLYAKVGMVDIILDDGGHTNAQTIATVGNAIDHVADGGMIVVEDTHVAYMRKLGNPGRSSIVERSKSFVDLMNVRSCRVDSSEPDLFGISSTVHSVQYFESSMAMKIDRRLCRRSSRTFHGSTSYLAAGRLSADYRNYGTFRSRLKQLFRSIRNS